MSTRGRGLSGSTTDLAPERRLEDVVAFVDSIGEPVSLLGESDGGALALGAAARTGAVSAVAAHEPVVLEAADEELLATLQETFPRVGQAVAEGILEEAARVFCQMVANEEEAQSLTASGYLEEAAGYMPILLQEIEQSTQSEAPGPTDPAVLAKVAVPTLLLYGSRSRLRPWFTAGVRHVAEHVADPRVRQIEGSGHFAVVLEPEAIAEGLIRFFAPTPLPS